MSENAHPQDYWNTSAAAGRLRDVAECYSDDEPVSVPKADLIAVLNYTESKLAEDGASPREAN